MLNQIYNLTAGRQEDYIFPLIDGPASWRSFHYFLSPFDRYNPRSTIFIPSTPVTSLVDQADPTTVGVFRCNSFVLHSRK